MMKKGLIFILLVLSLVLVTPVKTSANGIPYDTYTYSSSSRRFIWTQDAYVPLSIQYDLGGIDLVNPQDITVDKNNNIYIVDEGIKAVIKYNLETNESKLIGDGILQRPTGVHVGNDNKVYVTDLGTKQAYQFTYEEVTDSYIATNIYRKPVNTPYFDDNDAFEPRKVITDHANLVYILLAGNYNGLAKYNENAEFTGYFGGNQLPRTIDNMIKNLLFDEQQRRDWFKMIPKPVYNIAVDHSGLVLTTTKDVYGYKKLNIANQVYNESQWGYDDVEDIFVGPNHTIFTITKEGIITEYTPEGEVLFIFSGKDSFEQKGLFKSPTGIAVDSKNNIYAVDNIAKSLQVFIPTDFADTIHEAIMLYYDGKYSESLVPWQRVLKMNSLFDLATKGIGDAHFAQMKYEEAMQSYIVARDKQGYSQAYWEVRNKAMLNNGALMIGIIIGIILLFALNGIFKFGKLIKKPFKKIHSFLKKYKLYQELLYGFHVYKKPADAFYGIKREKKSSNLAALIYILLFFIAYIYWKYNTSFLFNNAIASEISVVNEAMFIFIPIILFIVSNYLVSSIKDGEGKMSNIFQGLAYTLLPLIIMLPILSIISNVLTLNEAFVYQILFIITIGVVVIYLIIMIKEIHFYDMKPTFSNILVTLFTALMLIIFTVIIYMLIQEVFGLVGDIIREVTNRA